MACTPLPFQVAFETREKQNDIRVAWLYIERSMLGMGCTGSVPARVGTKVQQHTASGAHIVLAIWITMATTSVVSSRRVLA